MGVFPEVSVFSLGIDSAHHPSHATEVPGLVDREEEVDFGLTPSDDGLRLRLVLKVLFGFGTGLPSALENFRVGLVEDGVARDRGRPDLVLDGLVHILLSETLDDEEPGEVGISLESGRAGGDRHVLEALVRQLQELAVLHVGITHHRTLLLHVQLRRLHVFEFRGLALQSWDVVSGALALNLRSRLRLRRL